MQYKNEVKIEPYDKRWSKLFKEESEKIVESLFSDKNNDFMSKDFFEIHHIGSTAVPSLPAKPIIDIMLEFDDLKFISFIKQKLKKLNYTEFTRNIIPHYSFFSRKQDGAIFYHLHISQRGDPQIK